MKIRKSMTLAHAILVVRGERMVGGKACVGKKINNRYWGGGGERKGKESGNWWLVGLLVGLRGRERN